MVNCTLHCEVQFYYRKGELMKKNLKWFDYVFIVLILGLIVFKVWLEMELIDYMAELIMKVQYSYSVKQIWQTGKMMLLVSGGSLVATIVSNNLSALVSANYARRLRSNIFAKVNSFSQEEINKFSTASLITRSTNDVTQVQNTMQMALRMLIMAPTMAIFSITRIVNSSIELSGATGIAVGLMFAMFIVLFIIVMPSFKRVQKQTDRLNLVSSENLTGIRVVRAYNAENIQEKKFDDVNKDIANTYYHIGKVMSFMDPGMNIISNGLILTIYWLGASLINAGSLQYFNLVKFTQYGMHILMSFMFLSWMIIMMPRAFVSARRIKDVLKTKSKVEPGTFDGKTEIAGKVEFKNVSFRYPDAELNTLENINFTVNKGETIAFIGSTGSGKSTLVNLIPRFFDATYGEVLVDGVNVKEYTHDALNKKLGFVPQKGVLFKGTVRENIGYGVEKLDENKMKECLDVAQANFVYDLENGLDYEVSQGGTNVSGGQRQRLCIARAIAKDPEIYIFDDSFSALDYKTDRVLRARLNEYTKSATKIIVAQRVGTIMDADKIVVLNEGKMVGMGTHKQLLKTCPVYKEIALSQLSKEEL